jgi:lipopolysaccharide transport system permease protein
MAAMRSPDVLETSKTRVYEARELPETVYTPESQARHPMRMLRNMLRDLAAARELGWRLAVRDISALYRQTVLGYLWAFVPALLMGVTLSIASQNKVIDFGESAIPFTAYVIIGMVLWQTFIESVTLQIQAVGKATDMLAKLHFPREALILSAAGQVLFNFAIKLVLVVAVFVWYRMPPPATVVLAPLALLLLLVLGTALGVLLAPLGALYQDVGRAVTTSTVALLIVTPAVFVPPKEGVFGTVVALNPITPLLTATRDLATTGSLTYPLGLIVSGAGAVVLLLLAWAVYRLSMPIIIERMSA